MNLRVCIVVLLVIGRIAAQASLTITPWTPLFQGIDLARGTNVPDSSTPIPNTQVMTVARVDLTNPDISLFTTPRIASYLAESRETAALSVSNFLTAHSQQLVINANFFSLVNGLDPAEGTGMEVLGLAISQGVVVSKEESSSQSTASLLFTTNNRPFFVMTNTAPGTNTLGIYTAVSGSYPLIANGRIVAPKDTNSPIPGLNSRVGFGVSEDERYLYLLAIDGGVNNGSGAYDTNTAYWLQLVGAYNAINMDGGGSTTLDMADCSGAAITLNRPFWVSLAGHERHTAHHLGISAKPLANFFSDVVVSPSDGTATITWETAAPSTAQIEYGPTAAYGSLSPSNATLLRNHVVTLDGLTPTNRIYYRIHCADGPNLYDYPCYFSLTNEPRIALFNVTNRWKYTTNNLDGVNWTAPAFNDSSWLGPSPGLFYIETNSHVQPRNTGLPPTGGSVTTQAVSPTYYFRTHFTFADNPTNVMHLYFTNYVDDGAVIYLNGQEAGRIRMTAAPAKIYYTNITDPPNVGPCGAPAYDATCADMIVLDSAVAPIPLVSGDNVVAAELHQASVGNTDAAFGAALSYNVVPSPQLNILWEANTMTLYWNGSGFTLQQADDPSGPWSDVPGPVTHSTYEVDSPAGVRFYKLRH